MKTIDVKLTVQDLKLLSEAIDSHVYWQLSESRERNSGFTVYPELDSPEFKEGEEEDQERWREMDAAEKLGHRLASIASAHEEPSKEDR